MLLSDICDPSSVREAAREYDALGRDVFLSKYGFEPARSHFLVLDEQLYDSTAILGAAYAYQYPERGAADSEELKRSEHLAAERLRELGFEVRIANPDAGTERGLADLLEEEREYRWGLWRELLSRGGPHDVTPQQIKELRIHTVQQGIWVDKLRTKHLTEDGGGVTIAVRHSGGIYTDELSEDGIIYHYPETSRESHDALEISATKACAELELPIFIVTTSADNRKLRDVHLGLVEDWDDASRYFLISFEKRSFQDSTTPPAEDTTLPPVEQLPLFTPDRRMKPGRQRFKFRVLKHYGPQCAVCPVAVRELLEAAHIQPTSAGGSDDPQNGLVFCALHHRAFDAGLFAVEPGSLRIRTKPSGPSPDGLQLTRSTIKHLLRIPHQKSLEWGWTVWSRENLETHGRQEREER